MSHTIKALFDEKINDKEIRIEVLHNGDLSIKCNCNIYNFNGLSNKEALKSVQEYERFTDDEIAYILKMVKNNPQKRGCNTVLSIIKSERNGFIKK